MDATYFVVLVLSLSWIRGYSSASSDTNAGQLARVVSQLQAQVLALQEARAQDQATILILQQRLHENWGGDVTTTTSSPTVTLPPQTEAGSSSLHTELHLGSRAARMLERERQSLFRLGAELRDLRNDLVGVVSAKEREIAITGTVGDLRLESDSFRAEIQRLRREVEAVRAQHEEDLAASRQLRATQVTTRWLQKTVEEIRREMREVAAAMNVSVTLRQRQMVEANMTLVRSDLSSLRREIEGFRAHQERDAASVVQLQQDVSEIRQRNQHISLKHQHLAEEVAAVRQDLMTRRLAAPEGNQEEDSYQTKTEQYNRIFASEQRRENFADVQSHDAGESHKMRHHGRLKMEMVHLQRIVDNIQGHQKAMEKDIRHLREGQHATNFSVARVQHNTGRLLNESAKCQGEQSALQRLIGELHNRLDVVEHQAQGNKGQLQNMSDSVAGIGKLHSSTVQLFEAMESMENQYDKSISDLQKEMSKFEFNVAQLQSSIKVALEDQTSQAQNWKSLKRQISTLQLESKRDHYRLLVLQSDVLNRTVQDSVLENGQATRDLRLSTLESRIAALTTEVNSKRRQLDSLHQQLERKVDLSALSQWETERQSLVTAVKNISSEMPTLQQNSLQVEKELSKFVDRLPTDCSMDPATWRPLQYKSGVYLIKPHGMSKAVEVFCDMDTDGGHWTVLQRRKDGSQDFYRTWEDYKTGFGTPDGELWIGNDIIHHMTNSSNYTLRMDMWDMFGRYKFAEYDIFYVTSEEDGYKLLVEGYHGNASNALDYHNGMSFSTRDKDNDASSTHCADYYSSGWWYNHCQYVNVNGKYKSGVTWFDIDSQEWVQLDRVEMKIRPSRLHQ